MRSGHVVTAHFTAIANAVSIAQNQADHPIVILPAETNRLDADALAPMARQVLHEIFGLEVAADA